MISLPFRSPFGRASGRVPAALACFLGLGCTTGPVLPDDVQVFGTYGSCVVRVADTCHEADAGCTTLPAELRSFTLGARASADDGGALPFFVAREGLPPLEGVLRGTRFEVATTLPVPSLCGCASAVTETLSGELLTNPIGEIEECLSRDVDGGTTCLGPGDEPPGRPDAGASDAGEVDAGWTSDAGVAIDRRYPAVVGRIVTEAVPADADAGCACLPCRAEFEFVGRP